MPRDTHFERSPEEKLEAMVTKIKDFFGGNGKFQQGGEPAKVPAGRKMLRSIVLLCFVGILCMITYFMFTEYLDPWECGIMQHKYGSGETYESVLYEGWKRYFVMPTRDELHHVPFNWQYVHITTQIEEKTHKETMVNEKGVEEAQEFTYYDVQPGTGLEVPTTDGSKVVSDITFVYKIFSSAKKDEQGNLINGGPDNLRAELSLNPDRWVRVIKEIGVDRCKRALGSLRTDDYYNAPLREEKAELARKLMNTTWISEKGEKMKGLNEMGIEIVAVLIRAYYYTPEIDVAISRKNLQVQVNALNKAKEMRETNAAEVAKVAAEGDALVKLKEEEWKQEVKKLNARGDLYEKSKMSEGDLLVNNANAEFTRLRAKALQGQSDLYVARKLAPLTSMVQGGIISDMNPLDLNEWVKRISGKKNLSGN